MKSRLPGLYAVLFAALFLSAASAQRADPLRPASRPAEQRDVRGIEPAVGIDDAEQDLDRLESSLPRLQARLKAEFENGAEWKAAIDAVKRGVKEYDAARKTALSRVRSTPEHARAASTHQKARQGYDAITTRPADTETNSRLMRELLNARSAVDKLEASELKADPDVARTKAALLKAQTDMAALRKRFDNTYESDPLWIAQKEQILTAEKTLSRARQEQARADQYLSQVRAEQEAAERARRDLMVQVEAQRIVIAAQSQILSQPVYVNAPVSVVSSGPVVYTARSSAPNPLCLPGQDGLRYRYVQSRLPTRRTRLRSAGEPVPSLASPPAIPAPGPLP